MSFGPKHVKVVQTAVICSQHDWMPAGQISLDTVHASPEYHGKEWYDNVVIKTGDNQFSHAQARLFFYC